MMRCLFFFLFLVGLPSVAVNTACNGQVTLGDLPGTDAGITGNHDESSVSDPGNATDADTVARDAGPQKCKTPDGVTHMFTSTADTLARLQGRWLTCAGAINEPADSVGLEFNGTTAYFLVQGPGGAFVRGPGSDYQRSVTIVDVTAMNGVGFDQYQINFDQLAGENMYFAQSFDNPPKLRMVEGTSGKVVEYVPIPAQPDGNGKDAGYDAVDTGADATPDSAIDACAPSGCTASCVTGAHNVSAMVGGCVVWECCVPDDAG